MVEWESFIYMKIQDYNPRCGGWNGPNVHGKKISTPFDHLPKGDRGASPLHGAGNPARQVE